MSISNDSATRLLEVLPDLSDVSRDLAAVADEWVEADPAMSPDRREARLVDLADIYDRLLPVLVACVSRTAVAVAPLTEVPWPSLRERVHALAALDDANTVLETVRLLADSLAAVAIDPTAGVSARALAAGTLNLVVEMLPAEDAEQ